MKAVCAQVEESSVYITHYNIQYASSFHGVFPAKRSGSEGLLNVFLHVDP